MNALENFISFLEETLIPDLKESGRSECVKDLTIAVKFMKGAKRAALMNRKTFCEHLKEREAELRSEGYECTPDDYFTARQFIYWSDT